MMKTRIFFYLLLAQTLCGASEKEPSLVVQLETDPFSRCLTGGIFEATRKHFGYTPHGQWPEGTVFSYKGTLWNAEQQQVKQEEREAPQNAYYKYVPHIYTTWHVILTRKSPPQDILADQLFFNAEVATVKGQDHIASDVTIRRPEISLGEPLKKHDGTVHCTTPVELFNCGHLIQGKNIVINSKNAIINKDTNIQKDSSCPYRKLDTRDISYTITEEKTIAQNRWYTDTQIVSTKGELRQTREVNVPDYWNVLQKRISIGEPQEFKSNPIRTYSDLTKTVIVGGLCAVAAVAAVWKYNK